MGTNNIDTRADIELRIQSYGLPALKARVIKPGLGLS